MVKVTTNPNAYPRIRTRAQALQVLPADFAGPVLRLLGQIHRRQELAIFSSEGARGAAGKWPALNPSYAARKRKAVGRKRMLVLTGETKARLTVASNPGYIQRFVASGQSSGVFQFGAASDIAAAHLYGNPALASPGRSKIFGGIAPRLPVRDMMSKTKAQIQEFSTAFTEWYIKRVRQVLRNAR